MKQTNEDKEYKCKLCALHSKCISNKIKGEGNPKAKIMVILDNPDYSADRNDTVANGNVGKILNYFLDKGGVNTKDCYFTYAVKCKADSVSDIKKKFTDQCVKHLRLEIARVKPELIIAMGKYSWMILTENTSVDEFRGHMSSVTIPYKVKISNVVKRSEFKTIVMPTYSPFAALGKWEYNSYIIRDIKKAVRFLDEGVIPKNKLPKTTVVMSADGIDKFEEEISQRPFAVIDAETTGFVHWKDEPIVWGYSLGNEKVFILPVREYTKEELEFGKKKWTEDDLKYALKINKFVRLNKEKIKETLIRVHSLKSMKKIGHNFKFDFKFAHAQGYPFDKIHFDTVLSDALLDENNFHDLNNCMEREGINWGPYDTKLWPYVGKKGEKPYSYVPPRILHKYLAIDVYGDELLMKAQFGKLKKNNNLYKIMFERQVPLLNLMAECELNGVRVDTHLISIASDAIQKSIDKTLAEIREFVGDAEFNPSSQKALPKLLESLDFPFEKLHIKKSKKTGLYSCGKDALVKFTRIKKYQKLPSLILKHRKLSKAKGTFVDGNNGDGDGGLVEHIDFNGFVHTTYNLHTPRTARLSSSSPNCLSMDTEILTVSGWKGYKEITKEDKVYNLNLTSGDIQIDSINDIYISENNKKSMVKIEGTHASFFMTDNHRFISKKRSGKLIVRPTIEVNPNLGESLIHSAIFNGGYDLDVNLIKLAVAFQADGSLSNKCKNYISFNFRKIRKVKRLISILKNLKVEYTLSEPNEKRPEYIFFIKAKLIPEWCLDKDFSSIIEGSSLKSRIAFIEELRFWDGDLSPKNIIYNNTNKRAVDRIQLISSISGYRCMCSVKYCETERLSALYRVHLTKRPCSRMEHTVFSTVNEECQVWCINTNNDTIITRRNGHVLITGNCQQFPRADKDVPINVRNFFIPPEQGWVTWEIDFSQLELRVIAFLAQDVTMIKEFQGGVDLHSRNCCMFNGTLHFLPEEAVLEENFIKIRKAKKPFNFLELPPEEQQKILLALEKAKELDHWRNVAKTLSFGKNYGLTDDTIADQYEIPVDDVNTMSDMYFNKYYGIASFMEKMKELAIKKGILTLPETGRMRRFTQFTDWINSKYAEDLWRKETYIDKIHNQAMNFPVQGYANEIYTAAKLGLFKEIKEKKLRAKLGFSIHDGQMNSAHIDDVLEVKEIAERHFKRVLGEGDLAVPLTADFEVYTRWKGEKIELADIAKWRERIMSKDYRDIDYKSLLK